MKEKYIEDIREIREIMNRSSRFISLSGVSGIAVGIIALAAAWLAHLLVFKDGPYLMADKTGIEASALARLLGLAIGTLAISAAAALYFTKRKSRKQKLKAWDHKSRRLLLNLLIPLLTGGIVCLIFLIRGYIGLLPALTLIFYGLALVNGSKYTLDEIRSLGLAQIVLGLAALQFSNQALLLWGIGFGLLHILYGWLIQRKYES